MKLDWRHALAVYIAFTLVFTLPTIGAPVAALTGNDAAASVLYNAAAPLCHQWIYRSHCIFSTQSGWMIDDCIPAGHEGKAVIATKYTSATHAYDGVFEYSRQQVGRNRAEYVERDGMFGYKLAVCTRDSAMYLGMLAAALVFALFRTRMRGVPHIGYLLLGLVPMGIDGTAQLFGLWESTQLSRIVTGAIAGLAIGIYIVLLLNEMFAQRKK
ncbi:MAG: DUF2085 domain-containing protein [Candidatus Micrarchaeia archaeon]